MHRTTTPLLLLLLPLGLVLGLLTGSGIFFYRWYKDWKKKKADRKRLLSPVGP